MNPSMLQVLLYPVVSLFLLLCIALATIVVFLRIRWREIGTPNPPKIMLHERDFRSVWDIAHLWTDQLRNENNAELPEHVADKVQKLIWAFVQKKITLRTRSAIRVPSDPLYWFVFSMNKPRAQLMEMLVQRRFSRAMLDSLFVMRSEVLKWCEDDYLTPPSIWAVGSKNGNGAEIAKAVIGKHRDEAIDKQLCQAIARTLWDIDPQVHPAHLFKHKAIQRYGNAKTYKDDETIRSWIAEVDPLKGQRKGGRPPVVPYILDLENGGLNKDSIKDLIIK